MIERNIVDPDVFERLFKVAGKGIKVSLQVSYMKDMITKIVAPQMDNNLGWLPFLCMLNCNLSMNFVDWDEMK